MDKNKKKKVYDDDDGRSIDDMSGLDPHHPFTGGWKFRAEER